MQKLDTIIAYLQETDEPPSLTFSFNRKYCNGPTKKPLDAKVEPAQNCSPKKPTALP